MFTSIFPSSSLPIKANLVPSLLPPTATLAGALLKAGAGARDKPPVGTKSANNSSNATISAIAEDAPKINLKKFKRKKKKKKKKKKKVVLGLCQYGLKLEFLDQGVGKSHSNFEFVGTF
jgi:hypothetical protein